MATLNFYLDKADKAGMHPILMTYLCDGKKFRHSIKLKVYPSQWTKKQRVKVKFPEDEFVNGHLDGLEEIITKAQKESLLTFNEIRFSFIKQKFDATLNKSDVKAKSFIEYFEEYQQVASSRIRATTLKRYVTTFNHLVSFSKAKRYELSFERINSDFYIKFLDYLMKEKQLLNNSIGGYIKIVKAFMSFATERGYNNVGLEFKKFKAFKEDTELIYLSEEELMHLLDLKLSSQSHIIVRENFCFACFTGLRFSDIQKLQPENLKNGHIEIRTEKTQEFLRIPLNPYAKQILERNNGILPKMFSNQKTNDFLKEIGYKAGFKDSILIVKYRGVEKVEFIEPKYKFLCTHTARRTFVTLSLEKGMRPETVMSITGHKDYKTFKKYIKITDKVKLVEMNKIWEKKLYIA